MAIKQPSVDYPASGIIRFKWNELALGDAGGEVTWLMCADRSVQVSGTLDGASVIIEGSNDGVAWATLTDPQGNALTIGSAKIEQVMEVCLHVRPSVSGGGAGTSADVTIVGRVQ